MKEQGWECDDWGMQLFSQTQRPCISDWNNIIRKLYNSDAGVQLTNVIFDDGAAFNVLISNVLLYVMNHEYFLTFIRLTITVD
jgi:hypothetical protein